MAFYVGQKVERVAAPSPKGFVIRSEEAHAHGARMSVIGQIYTVREVRIDHGDRQILLLEELDNSHMAGGKFGPREPGFRSYGFRPILERKTDISVFKAMLNPSHEEVPA